MRVNNFNYQTLVIQELNEDGHWCLGCSDCFDSHPSMDCCLCQILLGSTQILLSSISWLKEKSVFSIIVNIFIKKLQNIYISKILTHVLLTNLEFLQPHMVIIQQMMTLNSYTIDLLCSINAINACKEDYRYMHVLITHLDD